MTAKCPKCGAEDLKRDYTKVGMFVNYYIERCTVCGYLSEDKREQG